MLYIAAKAPRVGTVKTRLGQSIGDEHAAALYRAYLRDLAASFNDPPFGLGWYITPDCGWPEIARHLRPRARHGRVLAQGEGSWTERQARLFQEASTRGEERTVLIGSDSPHLTVETVCTAFDQLTCHDLVIGPTFDGGYYLLGMRGRHDVLSGLPMSTTTVCQDIVRRAEVAGLSVGQLEPTFDVDVVEDLAHLRRVLSVRDDLSATRNALARLDASSRALSQQSDEGTTGQVVARS